MKSAPDYEAEVEEAIARVIRTAGAERQRAARELCKLGVWTRGSVLPRGSPTKAVDNRLPNPDKLKDLINCLTETDPKALCQIIHALGQWGDEQAARAVTGILLNTDAGEDVRSYCIRALTMIGGPSSVDALTRARDQQLAAISSAAAAGLRELQTGGVLDYTEGITAQDLASSQHAARADADTEQGLRRASRHISLSAHGREELIVHGLEMIDPERIYPDLIYRYDEAWNETGLDIAGLLRSGPVPRSLVRAAQMLGRQPAEYWPLILQAMRSEKVWCPRLVYGSGEFWGRQLIEVWNDALCASRDKASRDCFDPAVTELLDERFVNSARARHIAITSKRIFPYPYFSTPSTADCFCVLPLGVQESVGLMIINRLTDVVDVARDAEAAQSDGGLSLAECGRIGQRAIAEIFRRLIAHDAAQVTFRIGYAIDEIVLDVLMQDSDPLLLDCFHEKRQLLDVDSNEHGQEEKTKRAVAVPGGWEGDGIFFFDPANQPTDDYLSRWDASKFIVAHGQQIPVGIGFTLPVLANLAVPLVRQSFFRRLDELGPPPDIQGIRWHRRRTLAQPAGVGG